MHKNNTNSMYSNQHQMQPDNMLFTSQNHNMADLAGPLNSLPYQQKNKMLHLIDHFNKKKQMKQMTYTFQPEIYESMYNPLLKKRLREVEKRLTQSQQMCSKANNIKLI